MTVNMPGAPIGAPPGLSDAERDRRWGLTRSLMEDAGVDLLLVFPIWIAMDAMWLAGQPGAVIFPRGSEPTIFLGGEDTVLEQGRPPGWITERVFVTRSNG